jgi:hypothetical protein
MEILAIFGWLTTIGALWSVITIETPIVFLGTFKTFDFPLHWPLQCPMFDTL